MTVPCPACVMTTLARGITSAWGTKERTTVFGAGKTAGATNLTEAQLPVVSIRDPANLVTMNQGGGGAGFSVSVGNTTFGSGTSHAHTLSLDLQYVSLIRATKD